MTRTRPTAALLLLYAPIIALAAWTNLATLTFSSLSVEPVPTNVPNRLRSIAPARVVDAGGEANVDAAPLVFAPSSTSGSADWVAEYLSPSIIQGKAQRASGFKPDRNTPELLRARDSDYQGTGWDRFHLAPAADFGDQTYMDLTFNLCNAAPGNVQLNRILWPKIESGIRGWVLADESRTAFVVTMPLYLYRATPPRSIGPRHVLVPTHFAKAMLALEDGEPKFTRAWLAPNETPPAKAKAEDYLTTVDALEQLKQLDLFEWLDDDLEKRLEAQK